LPVVYICNPTEIFDFIRDEGMLKRVIIALVELKSLRIDFSALLSPSAGNTQFWKHNLKHILPRILLIIFIRVNG